MTQPIEGAVAAAIAAVGCIVHVIRQACFSGEPMPKLGMDDSSSSTESLGKATALQSDL